MQNSEYLTNVTLRLERLLVFKQVFTEYINTCENILRGNCLASESLTNLRDYFMRNLLRFKPLVTEFTHHEAPACYTVLERDLRKFVLAYDEAISRVLNAIEDSRLDETNFERAKVDQADALDAIDSVFIDRIHIENGDLRVS